LYTGLFHQFLPIYVNGRPGGRRPDPYIVEYNNFTDYRQVKWTGEYAVVSLWYVIEHFGDCVPVFAEIHRLLKPGGVLAFATPSFSGISGRASLRRFLERSPADHWTIWSPALCKKALATAGFTVKKIVNCGHHPERFPLLGKYARTKKSPLYWVFLAFSKLFSLGDTFEAYAMKNERDRYLFPVSTP
jgi:SAM-dependent methyltransferase